MKDAIGNELKVGQTVVLRLPSPDTTGVVQAIQPGSVLSTVRGERTEMAIVTIYARFDIPVDPADAVLKNVVATLNPSLPPQEMSERAPAPPALEQLN